jgi:hypothetical protein
MAGEAGDGREADIVLESRAGGREQLLEHPAHGEDGGAGVERRAAGDHFAHLAAGRGGALQHGDFGALRGHRRGG